MATWPATLPYKPLNSSVQIAPEINVVEFAPDVGSPIRRKRYTARRKFYQGEMSLTDTQRDTLDTFFASDCYDGTTSFSMRDWLNLNSSSTVTYSWVQPPTFSRVGPNLWRVSLSLAKEP